MNLILLEEAELEAAHNDGATPSSPSSRPPLRSRRLPPDDARFEHAIEVLGSESGDSVRCAVVGGEISRWELRWEEVSVDDVRAHELNIGDVVMVETKSHGVLPATVTCVGEKKKAKKKAMEAGGEAGEAPSDPSSVQVHVTLRRAGLHFGSRVTVQRSKVLARREGLRLTQLSEEQTAAEAAGARVEAVHAEASDEEAAEAHLPAPHTEIYLLVACPRLRVWDKMLTCFACYGIEHIFVCGAEKVESTYLQSPKVSSPNYTRERLKIGVSQAAYSSHVPTLVAAHHKCSFPDFVKNTFMPAVRTIEERSGGRVAMLMGDEEAKGQTVRTAFKKLSARQDQRAADGQALVKSKCCIAIGPEGGWVDAERGVLVQSGFERVTLGDRIMRSHEATASLAALCHDAMKEMCTE